MDNHEIYLQEFEKYQWLLRSFKAKECEYNKINSQIKSGLISIDLIDENWENKIHSELSLLRNKLANIENMINSIPDSKTLIPCKLFLRLYYVLDFSLIDTASEMNISLSTLRRVRKRCAAYFDKYPKI